MQRCLLGTLSLMLCLSGVTQASQSLLGVYGAVLGGDPWRLAFDGTTLRVYKNEVQVIASQYRISGDRIEFHGDQGPFACIGSVSAGSYRWWVEGIELHFSNVDDRCPGRITVLTSRPWRLQSDMARNHPNPSASADTDHLT